MIGACAEAVATGELNDLEAFGILILLVSAGTESTTSLLGSGAFYKGLTTRYGGQGTNSAK